MTRLKTISLFLGLSLTAMTIADSPVASDLEIGNIDEPGALCYAYDTIKCPALPRCGQSTCSYKVNAYDIGDIDEHGVLQVSHLCESEVIDNVPTNPTTQVCVGDKDGTFELRSSVPNEETCYTVKSCQSACVVSNEVAEEGEMVVKDENDVVVSRKRYKVFKAYCQPLGDGIGQALSSVKVNYFVCTDEGNNCPRPSPPPPQQPPVSEIGG